MKKILALIVAACFMISGCGHKADTSNVGGKKDIERVVWLIGSEDQAISINEISGEFTARTGIKINCEAISWGDAHSKYLTSIAGGVAPDIGTLGLTWGTEFGNLGAIVDLSKAYSEEMTRMKGDVFTGLWDSIEFKGKVYGIPFDLTEHVLYYRSDIIAAPPTTWDELTKLLEELKGAGKGMIFDWGSMNWIGYSPFLWQAGGDYFGDGYKNVIVDSPQAVEAMKFFSELYTKYNVPKTKVPLEQGMRTGDFPLAISGNWNIDALRLGAPEIAGKWSIAALPEGPSGKFTAFIGGRIMGIFEQSKHKEEAWSFIKFLFKPETQAKLYDAAQSKQDTYLPPGIKTWDILNMDPAFKSVLVSQAHDAKGPPPVSHWDTSAKYIDEAIQKVILQGADPKTELDKAAKEMEKRLK